MEDVQRCGVLPPCLSRAPTFHTARDGRPKSRFEPAEAEIWLNDSSLLAGVKLLLGIDPKKSYRDKAAKVKLD